MNARESDTAKLETAVVLFVHHNNDATTRKHYELLVEHNDFPIVPLFCRDGRPGKAMPEAITLASSFSKGSNWHNVDWICRDWFLSCDRIDAQRYIWLDWDCLANEPLADWYGDCWSKDFVVSQIKRLDSKWGWFRRRKGQLPNGLASHRIGIAPLNGVLLSRRAMRAFCESDLPDGVISEMRLPTMLAAKGIHATEMPREKAKTNRYLPRNQSIAIHGTGLFHPVKN